MEVTGAEGLQESFEVSSWAGGGSRCRRLLSSGAALIFILAWCLQHFLKPAVVGRAKTSRKSASDGRQELRREGGQAEGCSDRTFSLHLTEASVVHGLWGVVDPGAGVWLLT